MESKLPISQHFVFVEVTVELLVDSPLDNLETDETSVYRNECCRCLSIDARQLFIQKRTWQVTHFITDTK